MFRITTKIKNVNPVFHKQTDYNTILTKFEVNFENKNELEQYINDKIEKLISTWEITEEEINLTYEHFSYNEVLKAFLFHEVPSSFEIIGKIAHLNLREKFLPYKNIIGKVILDVSYYKTKII